MFKKKIIFGLFLFSFLGACTAPTAMLGPAYTLTSTGNVLQAGLSYGTGELVKNYTGKTTMENLKDATNSIKNENENIQKITLESEKFYKLIEAKINKTSGILNLSNQ